MKVAVFGAGTMGSGIAQVFAAKGHTALMYASSTASAQRHKDKLAASLNKKVAKGRMTQEAADDIMSRVLVEEFDAAADADLVIECVAENMAVKKELLAKLDPSLMSALQELQSQLLNMLWQLVSSLSVVLVGGVSMATSFATSLPGFLIRLLLMVISTFFIAVDYQKIVRFCLGCLQGSTRNLVLQVKAYAVSYTHLTLPTIA